MGNLITVEGSAADVQELLREVGECVARWEAGSSGRGAVARVTGLSAAEMDALVQGLRVKARIDGNAIIHSTRPRLGPAIIRFQVALRRLTWWFLEPILQQMRAFQGDSALAIAALADENRLLRRELEELRAVVEGLARSPGDSRAYEGKVKADGS